LLINPIPGAKPVLDVNTLQTSEGLAQTYLKLARTRPILDQVIGNLGLNMRAAELEKEVSLTLVRDTQLIVLTVEDVSAPRSADIANEIVRVFVRESRRLQPNGYEPVVVEPAETPTSPARPNAPLNIVLGLAIGGVLAVGWVVYKTQTDESVKSVDEVKALIDIPTLSVIPLVKIHEGVLDGNESHALAIEAYQGLRARIGFLDADSHIRTVLITSSSPGEGKSFTAANLAVSLARSGKRTILVDADLRRPRQHEIFHQNNLLGVSTALAAPRDSDPFDHLISTGTHNLLLMPSGPREANPAALLGSPRMAELVQALRARADMVIVDTPPVLDVVDASLVARFCDGTLLVARAETTPADELRSATEELALAGARVAGVVLNALPAHGHRYYYRRLYR
jgi:capsular exopolysaccharide synthesis family protein